MVNFSFYYNIYFKFKRLFFLRNIFLIYNKSLNFKKEITTTNFVRIEINTILLVIKEKLIYANKILKYKIYDDIIIFYMILLEKYPNSTH